MNASMNTLTFFVQGLPKAQPRVKFASRGKFGKAYTPDSANDWKACLMIAAKPHFREPLAGAISASVCFYFPRPKSHFNSKGELKPTAPVFHTSKPDRDNLDKCVLDALTQIGAWNDDAQVCSGGIDKRFVATGESPGARITITRLTY
jgi:Holliday junction resolvase RusA-like endonuclease